MVDMTEFNKFKDWLASVKGVENPWKTIANRMLSDINHSLYDASNPFVAKEDKDELLKNETPPKDKFDFVSCIPPEPWQGNPLSAKLIILTLNPGYIEKQNHLLAESIQAMQQVNQSIATFKADTLLLKSDSFLPSDSINNTGLSTADYLNIIGDWYWYKKFTPLLEKLNGMTEDEFFKKVAIMQYIPYSSMSYKDKKYDDIQSKEFTRSLLRYILEKREDITVLVLRAYAKWKPIIDGIDKNPSCTVLYNRNRSQSISENNLKENFTTLLKALQ